MKRCLIFIFLLSFIACSEKHLSYNKAVNKGNSFNEDKYLIKAIFFENNNEFNEALNIYKFLYKKTRNSAYYVKYIEMLLDLKKYNEVIKKANKFLSYKWNDEVFKFKIYSLLNLGKIEEVKRELLTNFNKKDEFFYSMMSYILMKEGDYKEALIYTKSNYALNPTISNLLNLVDNLLKIKNYNEAIAYLQTYINENGCNYMVCLKLANIYKNLYEVDNLAYIYEKLGVYNEKFYIMALNLYVEEGDYNKAIKLINKYNLSKNYLLYIYEEKGAYKKAALLALYLYTTKGDINYLVKYVMDCYQVCKDKNSLKDIVNKLKFILTKVRNPYLYNMLGFLLINENINPKEGIKYIQKALEFEPDKIEYIDSLAWGYYKLGKCSEAWEIIKSIDSKDSEILRHKKLIKRCLDDFRENNSKNKRGFSKKKK